MSIEIIPPSPITIEIVNPTVTTLEIFPQISIVNDIGGTPVLVGDTAGGDLQGTYPNPTVHKIHTHNMQSGLPSNGDVWSYNSGPNSWQHRTLADAGIAAASHTHTTSNITDIDLNGYGDPNDSTLPLVVYDANDETLKVTTSSASGGDVSIAVTGSGVVVGSLNNKLGTIPRVKARSGTYETVAVTATGTSTVGLVGNCAYYMPIMFQFDHSFNNFVVSITTASATSNLRMALYTSDPDTGWITSTPYVQTNSFSGGSTGQIEVAPTAGVTLVNRNVQYWLAIKTDGAATHPQVRSINVASMIPLYHSLTSNNISCFIFENGTANFSTWRNFTTSPVTNSDFVTSANQVPCLGVKLQ
jgi:hypothetical protein